MSSESKKPPQVAVVRGVDWQDGIVEIGDVLWCEDPSAVNWAKSQPGVTSVEYRTICFDEIDFDNREFQNRVTPLVKPGQVAAVSNTKELYVSAMLTGNVFPPIVCLDMACLGACRPRYVMLDGHTRVSAVIDLRLELRESSKDIPAIIVQVESKSSAQMFARLANSRNGQPLTDADMQEIAFELRRDGLSLKAIAKRLGIGEDKVSNWVTTKEETLRVNRILHASGGVVLNRDVARFVKQLDDCDIESLGAEVFALGHPWVAEHLQQIIAAPARDRESRCLDVRRCAVEQKRGAVKRAKRGEGQRFKMYVTGLARTDIVRAWGEMTYAEQSLIGPQIVDWIKKIEWVVGQWKKMGDLVSDLLGGEGVRSSDC